MSSIGSGGATSWHSPLLKAAAQGDVTKVKELIEGVDKEKAGHEGLKHGLRQALQAAAARGHEAVVQFLFDQHAEIEAVGNEVSALFRAVEWGHCPVVQLLLTKGANIENKDKLQRTVLFIAVSKAHIEVIRILLDANANIEARDKFERTVLFLAA